MKVLHVVRSDGFSGVERHISSLAVAQARSGADVTVIGGAQESMTSLESEGVRTMGGDTIVDVMRSVRRAQRPDLVHAHMTAGELAACLSTTAPIVVTRHFARRRGTTPAGRASGMLVRRRVKAQMAISRYVAQAVEGPTTVVYPGVEPQDQPDPGSRRRVVLVVQRLQPEKNTDVAIRAFASGAPSDWTLEIVGRGAEEDSLRQLAHRLGVQRRVSFLGFRHDVPSLMRSSSVLLAPCEVEGLGLSVLEAMAHSLPVVASRAGAHLETVGLAADALLFEAGDANAAGAMLGGLCSDAERLQSYGQQLRAVQRVRFTPKAQAEATDAVYRQVLA